jgi:uncharacterized phage protein (TIGR02218 family)
MTFATRELGALTGEPVDLYEFRKGAIIYRFTSSDKEVVYQGQSFIPANLSRSEARQGISMVQSSMKIKTTVDNDAAQWFLTRIPTEEATLRIVTTHRISGTLNSEDPGAILIFGRLAPPIRDRDRVTFEVMPYQGLLKAYVLRQTFQPVCNHVIYDDFCGLNHAEWKEEGILASISGTSVNITGLASFPDDYFQGGFISVLGEKVTIMRSVAGAMTLFENLPSSMVGEECEVHPGCSNNHNICRDTFNNMPNNLGFYMVPIIDPFNGNSLKGDT